MLAWVLKPWLDRRRRERGEQIKALEQWHQIFEEWLSITGDYAEATEMAKQGLTYMAMMIKRYYLPVVAEQLNQRSTFLAREING